MGVSWPHCNLNAAQPALRTPWFVPSVVFSPWPPPWTATARRSNRVSSRAFMAPWTVLTAQKLETGEKEWVKYRAIRLI